MYVRFDSQAFMGYFIYNDADFYTFKFLKIKQCIIARKVSLL